MKSDVYFLMGVATISIPQVSIEHFRTAFELQKKEAIRAACENCIQCGGHCGHIDREPNLMFECEELRVMREILDKH